jgi:PhnB protein
VPDNLREERAMTAQLNPYLAFRDNAKEAMEFYRSVFGGELEVMTFAEMPDMPSDPSEADRVMHSSLTTENGLRLMASDTPDSMELPTESSVTLSLTGDDEPVLRGWWDGLVEGGTITEPLVPAPWGDIFGMCTDRFGTKWMVSIGQPQG